MTQSIQKYFIYFFILLSNSFSQNVEIFGPDTFVIIEEGMSGFDANLDSGDRFSRDHDNAGDINGDGVMDLVVGARSDDDGATDAGAVYILFMNQDGTVQSNQKISMLEGGFTDTLTAGSFFGYGVAGIGDYDNDFIPDIAVTSNQNLYIIHLNMDGTVKDFVKNQNINSMGLSAIGDLNGDGRIDLVACKPNANDGGQGRGAIDILFFDSTSTIIEESTVTISSTQGGFGEGIEDGDGFGGREVALIGDLDGDGNMELAVGSFKADSGRGAIWILSLDATDYHVVSKLKIGENQGGFDEILPLTENSNGSIGAMFGHALCATGDLNGDGIPDLISGANQVNEGVAYILYLNEDKSIKTFQRINNEEGGFDLDLNDGGQNGTGERFSRSISFLGDLREDGTLAINIGGGAGGSGTLYILFFKPCEISNQNGNYFWQGGNILFSNWTHSTQSVDGPLSYEQCAFKAFETDAPNITFNEDDGRCICKDSTASLSNSSEGSEAFMNHCSSSSIILDCDSAYTYYSELPSNVTILVGDSCLYDADIEVLDSIISQNGLVYDSPLELGTQTWFNGRLRFWVAGNYGNSSGVNDTIFTLPENIGNLTGLASLYLEWNRISVLPESFSEMIGLQSFYINNNILTSLGDNIGNVENLYFLDLGYNELLSIPESICNLSNLTYLWLFNNNLQTLPDCFCDLDLDWSGDDNAWYPYFGIGDNLVCENIPDCLESIDPNNCGSNISHFDMSLDQSYYAFHVYTPQDCDSVSISESPFPYQFKISHPYPNPFNPVTLLSLQIPFDRKMDILVFDLLGNEVDIISHEKIYKSGTHTIQWDGRNFPSGIYFIKIKDGMDVQIRKMILVK
jgi:hypothetical protein